MFYIGFSQCTAAPAALSLLAAAVLPLPSRAWELGLSLGLVGRVGIRVRSQCKYFSCLIKKRSRGWRRAATWHRSWATCGMWHVSHASSSSRRRRSWRRRRRRSGTWSGKKRTQMHLQLMFALRWCCPYCVGQTHTHIHTHTRTHIYIHPHREP